MSAVSLLAVVGASVVGSAHCAAMCGGFVAAYAGNGARSSLERAASHAAYNTGRLVTYVALGAAAGALGAQLNLAGTASGIAQVAAIATGIVLLLSGAAGLWPRQKLVQLRSRSPRGPSLVARALLHARDKPVVVRALLLGLFTTLLPCGWLYAFVAVAAGTGGAPSGALLMAAFWLGTLPALLGVGLSIQTLSARLAHKLPRLRAGFVLLAGALTLTFRFEGAAPLSSGAAKPGPASVAAPLPNAVDCPYHTRPKRPGDPS
jgi:sulfite exporter TauE/SafE